MQRTIFRSLLSAALLTVFPLVSPLLAQDADLEEPADTSDIVLLVAKGAGPTPFVLSDKVITERLGQLDGCLQLRNTGVVKGYIKTYVQLKSEKTRTMLGKRLTYFPLFEDKLKEYGLPSDLKYLSVVESALNPTAVSRVGATGLWQFMPRTGADYDLEQSTAVEERSNPVKSTEAAMRYLKDLHTQYNDWALALAAYNSGPARVNYAIRKAHSRNFWSIQRYLPKETRNYVPAFIAATYICNYFQLHNLEPYDPDFDEQLITHLRVFENLTFRDISDATGLDYTVIKSLNPGFKRDYIPASEKGYYVVLPKRVMPAFIRYLNTLGGQHYDLEGNTEYVNGGVVGDGRYMQLSVAVQQAEDVETFAKRIGIHPEHLKSWNKLYSNLLTQGQRLTIWRPVYVFKHQNLRLDGAATVQKENTSAPGKQPVQGAKRETAAKPIEVRRTEKPEGPQFQWHVVRRHESLDDVARQYSVSPESIRKLNNVTSIKFGMRLKVREL